jgi:hypothetical protein
MGIMEGIREDGVRTWGNGLQIIVGQPRIDHNPLLLLRSFWQIQLN